MTAYYNEMDGYAAAWLRNLITAGHIAPGDVDERSIVDVRPDDVRGYTQCHWFAGIGGWSLAMRLAGFPDDRPVWTGSCPCQPFSSAGKRTGGSDERHLWPHWFRLIRKCKPTVIFGENVEQAIGWGWLDAVCSDLEAEGYATGAAVLPACSVGAPHIRQRLWFVAESECERIRGAGCGAVETASRGMQGADGQRERLRADVGAGDVAVGFMAGADGWGRGLERVGGLFDGERSALRNDADGRGRMGDAISPRFQEQRGFGSFPPSEGGTDSREASKRAGASTFWSSCDWLHCTDGKARPVEPGSFPLAHGVQRRASKLRAYGNAIVPQVAAEFIKASIYK